VRAMVDSVVVVFNNYLEENLFYDDLEENSSPKNYNKHCGHKKGVFAGLYVK
jgi:hypothetical protein